MWLPGFGFEGVLPPVMVEPLQGADFPLFRVLLRNPTRVPNSPTLARLRLSPANHLDSPSSSEVGVLL